MTATTRSIATALLAAAAAIVPAAGAQAQLNVTAAYQPLTDTYCVVRDTSTPDAMMWSHANKGKCLTRRDWQARGVQFDEARSVTIEAATAPKSSVRAS